MTDIREVFTERFKQATGDAFESIVRHIELKSPALANRLRSFRVDKGGRIDSSGANEARTSTYFNPDPNNPAIIVGIETLEVARSMGASPNGNAAVELAIVHELAHAMAPGGHLTPAQRNAAE